MIYTYSLYKTDRYVLSTSRVKRIISLKVEISNNKFTEVKQNMDGKFMKIKQVVIPTLTLLLIASQLTGCASTTQKEMLQMINNQEAITIEIAEPINQEQGTTIEWDWEALAKTQTHPEFRENFDDILNITAHGTDGKNGVLYVDPAGNHTNDSTLRYAFQNKKFIDNVWNNTETTKQLIDLAKETFTDVETDQEALIAAINAYYNLILDSEPGYANLNSTVTRIEAMATVHRADTPINDILDKTTYSEEFDVAIGYHEYSLLAQELASQNYLDYKNKSLDEETANNTITRAEFIYLLVQRYYSDEYASVTGKEKCYSDCKNGGNIALDVGFITKDKSTGEITYKDRWQSYELSYALNNSKVGMPDDLYKAMVVAQNHNLITGSESRWDDGLTKGEAINFIIKVYTDLGTITNADRGESTGSVVDSEIQTSVNAYESLSQDNIIQLDDGTYDFTDDFLGTVMSYDYFAGSTEQEVKDYLNEVIDIIIIDRSPEEISESLGALGFSTGSTLKQDTTNQNTSSSVGEDSSTESGSNESSPTEPPVQSNPSQPSGSTGGLITDPNYEFNLDPSIWGNTETGGLGEGGVIIDSGVTLH